VGANPHKNIFSIFLSSLSARLNIDRKPFLSILPPLDFDWKAEIDQSCLKEREREHVARMRVERIIELIAAALPELEMRAVAPERQQCEAILKPTLGPRWN
jgi:hypothetical protein